MTQIQKELSERYLTGISSQITPGTSMHTEYGDVSHSKGRVSSIEVSLPNGNVIDFSQDADGNAAPGWIERTRIPGHDDERTDDFRERVIFPQHEGDIAFMENVLRAVQEHREDQVA